MSPDARPQKVIPDEKLSRAAAPRGKARRRLTDPAATPSVGLWRLGRVLRLSLLLLAVPGASAAADAPGAKPEIAAAYVGPRRMVEVQKDRRLNLVCMGQAGPTVLFDAGGSDWSVVWALVQPRIAREAVACAYDRAGLGYSDPARGARSPAAIAEDLHDLIRAAGLKTPLILVGHSLGGFNVKLYAALHPEDVSGLVLADPAEERTWDRTRSLMSSKFGAPLAARAELLDQDWVGRLVRHFADCDAAARDKGLEAGSPTYRRCTDPVRPLLGAEVAAERERLQTSAAYQAAQASEIANSVYGQHAADPVYERLFRPGVFGDRPLIVLHHLEPPSDDPLDGLDAAQGLALHRETARLSRRGQERDVPGSGHYIELDAPETLVAAVREVIATSQRR